MRRLIANSKLILNQRPWTLDPGPWASGFTLFELLIVLMIIGLVSALVIPKVGGNFNALKLKADTKKVAAALRYARSQAVSENLTIGATFDPAEGRLSISADHIKSEKDYPWTNRPLSEETPLARHVLTVADGIRLELPDDAAMPMADGLAQIVFYPSGGCSGGTVLLAADGGKAYKVVVDDILGAVKVQELFENDPS